MDTLASLEQLEDNFANNRYTLTFDKFGEVAFKCHTLVTPGVSLGESIFPTKFRMMSVEGDEVTYDNMDITFVCDKNLKNYMMLYKWINSAGFSDNDEQFPELQEYIDNNGNITTNATVLFQDSDFKPFLTMELKGIFPVNLSGLSLDNPADAYDPAVTATASFKVQGVQFSRPARSEPLL